MVDKEMQTEEADVEGEEVEVEDVEVDVEGVEVDVAEAGGTPLSPNSKHKADHKARIDAFRSESNQLNVLVPGQEGRRKKKRGHRERREENSREEKKMAEKRKHSVVDEVEEHQRLIRAVEMVQKHWRGVRSKRIWVDMLEKMMDAEVDLSGLDLST